MIFLDKRLKQKSNHVYIIKQMMTSDLISPWLIQKAVKLRKGKDFFSIVEVQYVTTVLMTRQQKLSVGTWSTVIQLDGHLKEK